MTPLRGLLSSQPAVWRSVVAPVGTTYCLGAGDSLPELAELRGIVNDCIDRSERISEARGELDDIWNRLIDDEDQESYSEV